MDFIIIKVTMVVNIFIVDSYCYYYFQIEKYHILIFSKDNFFSQINLYLVYPLLIIIFPNFNL